MAHKTTNEWFTHWGGDFIQATHLWGDCLVASLEVVRVVNLIASSSSNDHNDGLVQERRNSSALAMELHLSCTNPSTSSHMDHRPFFLSLMIFVGFTYHAFVCWYQSWITSILASLFSDAKYWPFCSGLIVFNSLWPSDAIWRQRSGSTLAQVMACCLRAPSHYLNQYWLIISEVQRHSPGSNFIRDVPTIKR